MAEPVTKKPKIEEEVVIITPAAAAIAIIDEDESINANNPWKSDGSTLGNMIATLALASRNSNASGSPLAYVARNPFLFNSLVKFCGIEYNKKIGDVIVADPKIGIACRALYAIPCDDAMKGKPINITGHIFRPAARRSYGFRAAGLGAGDLIVDTPLGPQGSVSGVTCCERTELGLVCTSAGPKASSCVFIILTHDNPASVGRIITLHVEGVKNRLFLDPGKAKFTLSTTINGMALYGPQKLKDVTPTGRAYHVSLSNHPSGNMLIDHTLLVDTVKPDGNHVYTCDFTPNDINDFEDP